MPFSNGGNSSDVIALENWLSILYSFYLLFFFFTDYLLFFLLYLLFFFLLFLFFYQFSKLSEQLLMFICNVGYSHSRCLGIERGSPMEKTAALLLAARQTLVRRRWSEGVRLKLGRGKLN